MNLFRETKHRYEQTKIRLSDWGFRAGRYVDFALGRQHPSDPTEMFGAKQTKKSNSTGGVAIDNELVKTRAYVNDQHSRFLEHPLASMMIGDERLAGLFLVDDNLLKDQNFASQIQARKMALLSRDWDIVPGGDSPADREATDFVRWTLENIEGTIHTVFDSALDALSMGFSIAEEKWEYQNDGPYSGKWRLAALKDKDPKYFRFKQDAYGNLHPTEGVQYITNAGTLMEGYPPSKFFIYVNQKRRDNWYGTSLGIACAWPIWFKKVAMRSWNILLQKFGNPTTIGKYPKGASESKVEDFAASVENLTNQSSMVMLKGPEGHEYSVELLESARSGDAGYHLFISYLDNANSKRINGGTLTSDAGTKGARSLGDIHQENKMQFALFDGFVVGDSFTEQCIKRMVGFNFPPATNTPRFVFRSIAGRKMRDMLDAIGRAQEVGLEVDPQWAHEMTELPELPDGVKPLVPLKVKVSSKTDGRPQQSLGPDKPTEFEAFKEYPLQGMSRPLTTWEQYSDIAGIKVMISQVEMAGMRIGSEAMGVVQESLLEKLRGKYRSRSGRIKLGLDNIRFSIDVSPIRSIIADIEMVAWAWGALTGTENMERLGFRWKPTRFVKFEEIEGYAISADDRSIVPTAARSMKGFSSRIPFGKPEVDKVMAGFMQSAYTIAGSIQSHLDRMVKPTLLEATQDAMTFDEIEGPLKAHFMSFIGENGSGGPMLQEVLRPCIVRAFNLGRKAVFMDKEAAGFVAAFQYCNIVGGVKNPITAMNDKKVYAIDSPRWSWLLPPGYAMDVATIIPIPSTAQVEMDETPNPDPHPDPGFGSVLATREVA